MNKMQQVKIIKIKPYKYRDSDKDGIPNWLDCKPYDPTKQGAVTDALRKVGGKAKEYAEERRQEQRGRAATRAETANYIYLLYKQNNRWYQVGPFPPEEIIQRQASLSKVRGVTAIRRSKRAGVHELLNAKEGTQKHLGRVASNIEKEERRQEQRPQRRPPPQTHRRPTQRAPPQPYQRPKSRKQGMFFTLS